MPLAVVASPAPHTTAVTPLERSERGLFVQVVVIAAVGSGFRSPRPYARLAGAVGFWLERHSRERRSGREEEALPTAQAADLMIARRAGLAWFSIGHPSRKKTAVGFHERAKETTGNRGEGCRSGKP